MKTFFIFDQVMNVRRGLRLIVWMYDTRQMRWRSKSVQVPCEEVQDCQ